MYKSYKILIPIFFLFLLLFPIVEKAVHAFEHHDETQCAITDKHFHEQEHECSICDFTLLDSNSFQKNEVAFLVSVQNFSFLPFSQNLDVPFRYYNLPSRGPPTI